MNRALLSLLVFIAFCLPTKAADVVFPFANFQGSPAAVKSVKFEAIGIASTVGTNIVTRDWSDQTTSTNGSVTFTNVNGAGYYRATIHGKTDSVYTNYFSTDDLTNSTLNAALYLTNAVQGVTNGTYSQGYINATFLPKTNGSAISLTASNVTLKGTSAAVAGYVWTATNSSGLGVWAASAAGMDTNTFVGTNEFALTNAIRIATNTALQSQITANTGNIVINSNNNTTVSNLVVANKNSQTVSNSTYVQNTNGTAWTLSATNIYNTNTIVSSQAGTLVLNGSFIWNGAFYGGSTAGGYLILETGVWNMYQDGDVLSYHNTNAFPWVGTWIKDAGGTYPTPIVFRAGGALGYDGVDVQAQLDSKLAINGDGSLVTNIPPTAIVSNGTQIVNGVLATNTLNTGFYQQTGTNRRLTLNGNPLTNLNAAQLTGVANLTNPIVNGLTLSGANTNAGTMLNATNLSSAYFSNAVPLTVSSPNSFYQSWSNAAITFTGLNLNITNVGSATGSLLADFQINSTSQMAFAVGGYVLGPYFVGFRPYIKMSQSALYEFGAFTIGAGTYGTAGVTINSGNPAVTLNSIAGQFIINSDTVLTRDAANTFAQRNGSAAQTNRIYGFLNGSIVSGSPTNAAWLDRSAVSNNAIFFDSRIGVSNLNSATLPIIFRTFTSNNVALTNIILRANGVIGLPSMTKAVRDALTATAGDMIYQNDNTPGLRVYNGANWMRYTETTD
jgi:hypothetical protein